MPTISGGAINLNNNSNFPVNINTGTSSGDIFLGNPANRIILPAFNTAGVFINNAIGELSTGLIVSNDIADGTIINEDVNSAASIDATKLIDGSVSNLELGYINTLTGNAQTQLDNLGAQVTDINTLADGRIYLGDNANTAQEVLMSGDATISNTGVVTVGRINGSALGTTTAANNNILVANGTQWNLLH